MNEPSKQFIDIEHGREPAELTGHTYTPSQLPCNGETENRWKGWVTWWGLKKGDVVGVRMAVQKRDYSDDPTAGIEIGGMFKYALAEVVHLNFSQPQHRVPRQITVAVLDGYPTELNGKYYGKGSKCSAAYRLGDRKYQLVAPTPAVVAAAHEKAEFPTARLTFADHGDGAGQSDDPEAYYQGKTGSRGRKLKVRAEQQRKRRNAQKAKM
ncbi:hypothetical protein [Algisphaera agarilytica]|uniref:Uncharacterized protein n=1 Tax=Algisphaera agarilytica TaxID=1385975 RepID=A0A7X0LJK4_9BACT|nr:hypothetical protein [Algisphaera agarilytica]MBB6428849.1 hypothetical protein [Algisphaera agarilytica]